MNINTKKTIQVLSAQKPNDAQNNRLKTLDGQRYEGKAINRNSSLNINIKMSPIQ